MSTRIAIDVINVIDDRRF